MSLNYHVDFFNIDTKHPQMDRFVGALAKTVSAWPWRCFSVWWSTTSATQNYLKILCWCFLVVSSCKFTASYKQLLFMLGFWLRLVPLGRRICWRSARALKDIHSLRGQLHIIVCLQELSFGHDCLRNLKMMVSKFGISYSRVSFSGSMLNFGRVSPFMFLDR